MNDNEVYTITKGKMFINGNVITSEDVETEIDNVINELRATNDSSEMDNVITTMIGMNKFSLFYLCKALYGYRNWWLDTEQDDVRGDTFEDYIESVHGLNPTVMGRYVSIWHKRDTGQFPKAITMRPIKDQQAIADALDQGYEISEENWEELEDASNNTQVHAILRKIKGKEPTKASYVGYLERSGDVVYWHQEQRFHVGYIKPVEQAENELERKVLEKVKARALSGLGLIEK